MSEKTETELLQERREQIRQQYCDFLAGLVSYNNGMTFQPRSRKPEQWKRVAVQEPIADLTTTPNVWVWSDLHFGHKNIIKFSDRPFVDIDVMDQQLIDTFNQTVGPDDVSVWVGDVTFYNVTKSKQIVQRMNGYKILVAGNHDFEHGHLKDMGFDEVHISYVLPIEGMELVFTHYPFPVDYPSVNVHGHEHIAKDRTAFSHSLSHINVCCEFHNYTPLNLKEITGWAKTRIESHDPGNKREKW